MIDISGHLRDVRRDVGFSDFERELVLNCCGYQFFNKNNYSRIRPNGRFDYLLIYLISGSGRFLVDGELKEATSGDIVIYKPYEHQHYEFFEGSQDYWIHFTGSQALDHLLRHFGNDKYFNIGTHQNIAFYFNSIREELLLKGKDFEKVINLQFNLLLKLISRYRIDDKALNERLNIFNHLILTLNDTYHDDWDVDKMASLCNLSKSRFLHLFKEQKGISPMQYLIKLRIDKAKELMIHSSISIQDVANLVGYSDPLYFSRLFKKYNGCSPRQYINANLNYSCEQCLLTNPSEP